MFCTLQHTLRLISHPAGGSLFLHPPSSSSTIRFDDTVETGSCSRSAALHSLHAYRQHTTLLSTHPYIFMTSHRRAYTVRFFIPAFRQILFSMTGQRNVNTSLKQSDLACFLTPVCLLQVRYNYVKATQRWPSSTVNYSKDELQGVSREWSELFRNTNQKAVWVPFEQSVMT